MSRVEQLLRELAPSGVQFKLLGDIAELVRGNGMPKSDLTDAGVGAIHYGQIYTRYGAWTQQTVSFVAPDSAAKLAKVLPGDLVITNTSENLEDVGKAVAWIGEDPIVTGGHATVIRHNEDAKYLSYWFQSESFRSQKRALATGTKVIDVSARQLAKVRIPVPPLEVQREIVRTLDPFTELESGLELTLKAEAEARRLQAARSHSALLNDNTSMETTIRLGEVVSLQVGFPFKSSRFSSDASDIRLLRGDNIGQGFLHGRAFQRWRRDPGDMLHPYELRAGDVVLAMDRPLVSAGLKWVQLTAEDLPALLVQRVARLRANADLLDGDYLARVIGSPEFAAHVLSRQGGNTVPHISAADVSDFRVSLPSLAQQRRIATAIGELDGSVSGLVQALTAEICARRKQYEYYRDKLLTFEEAAA